MEKRIVGVDIGGTSINVGLVQNNLLVRQAKVTTPASEGKDVVINAVIEGIKEVSAGNELSGIGIGVPGLLDAKKGVVYDLVNIPSWSEVHLAQAIQDQFKVEVFLANDANCFVVGEKIYGKGRDYDSIAGITLGTGLGIGFVFNNQLHTGVMSAAGEVGAIPYMMHNYEHYCSGKFFHKEFGLDGNEVFHRAMEGHQVSKGIFRQYGLHLGYLIKHLLHIVAPQAILIGGSIKDAYPFFVDGIWEILDSFPYKRVIDNLVIDKSELHNVAVMGAAAVYEISSRKQESVTAPRLE